MENASENFKDQAKKDCEMQIIIMFQFFIVQSIEKLITFSTKKINSTRVCM